MAAGVAQRSVLRTLKGWPGWLALAAAVGALFVLAWQRGAEPASADERVQAVTERLACPVCDGESAAESRSGAALEIRDLVRQHVADGKLSDDEIVERIDDAFVEDLRLSPEGSGLGLLAYLLPVVAAVAAVGGLIAAMLRWRSLSTATAAATDADRALVAEALSRRREVDT